MKCSSQDKQAFTTEDKLLKFLFKFLPSELGKLPWLDKLFLIFSETENILRKLDVQKKTVHTKGVTI